VAEIREKFPGLEQRRGGGKALTHVKIHELACVFFGVFNNALIPDSMKPVITDPDPVNMFRRSGWTTPTPARERSP